VPSTNSVAADDALALESQVCFALAVASRRVIALYRPLLEPMGLTHPQYLVMLALWQHRQLTVRRLSELVSLDPATISPLLKRLESTGYISRHRDPDDERALMVMPTSAGMALRERALAIPPAVKGRLQMDAGQLERLHALLSEVIDRSDPGQ
jgi:DNA-binding MarR family transcriptional regulator